MFLFVEFIVEQEKWNRRFEFIVFMKIACCFGASSWMGLLKNMLITSLHGGSV